MKPAKIVDTANLKSTWLATVGLTTEAWDDGRQMTLGNKLHDVLQVDGKII